MTTQKESANWIQNCISQSWEANSAENGITASSYHEFILHEKDLIADGRLEPGGRGEILRRERKESFEAEHPELAELMRTQHSEQPPHHFSVPKTAEELLDEGARLDEHAGIGPAWELERDYSMSLEDYVRGEGEVVCGFLWEGAASKYPYYRQEFRGLRQRLKLVEEVKMHSSQEEQTHLRTLFSSVSDTIAQQFLTDILISRRIAEPGRIDTSLSYQTEANNMASELGFQEGWTGRNITTRQLAGTVLLGRLRINYQPPLPQSSAHRPGK